MKSRFLIVTLSLVLGLLAAVAATGYVSSARAKVAAEAKPRIAYVTTKPVSAGTSFEEMLTKAAVEKADVPDKYVPDDAITSPDQLSGRVLLYDLAAGEALTVSKFKSEQGSTVAGQIPKDKVAVAIPVDEVTGVGASLSPGDIVVLFATFSPGPGGQDVTRVLLPRAQVIASSLGRPAGSGALGAGSAASGKNSVTLALTPSEAEKAVFAAEKGHLWIGLRPLAKELNASTKGQTMRSVFR
ncbi:MAG: Flp pilus assembly protein CpaB [Actinobacteria bacterium]|nr:MAG: Flp pilus assembly protein CpaB [Actinomycetota bacterium]